ncbi:MAG TPA: hypothetical protein VN157_15445, partial [Caulobacter sp.]|nr:hypothetical protein [Caulobacter sp.]
MATSAVVKRLRPGEVATIVDRYQDWVNLDFGEEACWAPAASLVSDDRPSRSEPTRLSTRAKARQVKAGRSAR